MKKKFLIYILFISFLFSVIMFSGCKKFVETDSPETQANALNVYTNDATAIAVLTGIYTRIAQGSPTPNISSGTGSFSLRAGLSADEFVLFSGADATLTAFYQNALIPTSSANPNGIGTDYWNVLYDHVYYTNVAIEGLNDSRGLTEAVKKQLMGEAKFMRGLFYFYLVNLYGDVPLVLSSDYTKNTQLPRSPKAHVYQQIITDLKEAEELLSADYLDAKLHKYKGIAERVRPTKGAATALLARTYLYLGNLTGDAGNYINAELQATLVINNNILYDTVSINSVFTKNNKEAIFQLQPTKSNQNTDDSKMFIITTGLSNSIPVRLSDTLLNSFESSDLRAKPKNWVDTVRIPAATGPLLYYPYKYKNNAANVTEYLMVLRLAEQYLIRAEARTQQDKISDAKADLNIIRKRAGLPNTTASDKSSLLSAILHERQVEFFSEWGHRWFDLKRTNNVDAHMTIMTPKKANGAPWKSFQKLYPISFNEILQGPNLSQTEGY